MRRIATTMILIAGLALSACNTVKGAGKDVSSAGDAVAKTATKSGAK